MMTKKSLLSGLLVFLMAVGLMDPHPSFAQDLFAKDNPDINKFEFARSYISALGYMKDIHDRWQKNAPKKHFTKQKTKFILATINDLSLDSTDLLIIKNYLIKYRSSPNNLMHRIADMVVEATDREITINHQEKRLWQDWYDLNAAKQVTKAKEVEFINAEYSLELRRKEAEKTIVQASVMMTKALMSAKNKNGKGHLLAITAQQRQKLLDKLDSWGSENLDWGLKTGQNTLDGSIAVIREILEDSLWISRDEK